MNIREPQNRTFDYGVSEFHRNWMAFSCTGLLIVHSHNSSGITLNLGLPATSDILRPKKAGELCPLTKGGVFCRISYEVLVVVSSVKMSIHEAEAVKKATSMLGAVSKGINWK